MGGRSAFERQLKEIQQDILRLGSLVEQAVYDSVQALTKLDVAMAAQVIMGDEVVDELCREIEDKCVMIIATQQPMARDLRVAVAAIKIVLSLERMGDHCVDIARATMCLSGHPLRVKPVQYIPEMAGIAQRMVKDSLDAYVSGDVEKAGDMCAMDDDVDFIFNRIFRELIGCIKEDPANAYQSAYLLYVSRYIERIADHATNIGEAVIYLVTGERRELN
ncbi:phosphate signaling complex protein PhoU [Desulfallas sp. Bu1-1]|jgi:phosphate transport system protein|uniref:phosphate signaling complex protein PhoU n=1 Tax=Desulfallas sp. Bu1-1 TaxID=2787620 RepID=UPI00189E48E3|nr:phosphate signaling complex protein PhoU [Desulfallas sp. Bu1-1]MBF7083186.1 phosphate signaling complex protein PhoU [Desulfallas sp. Bu1-1]